MEMELVKCKMLAFILALTVTCWAQTTTPSQTPDPGKTPATAAECACCAKTASADQNEGHACMHDKASAKDAKETASCCSGQDGKTTAQNCCAGSRCKHDHSDHATPGN
jgi:hypothetical protein